MNSDFRQDRIDPLLEAAYAELRAEPVPEPDWDALRSSISRRTNPVLSRRKVRRLVHTSRPLVPFAIAASLAFGLWIGPAQVREMMGPQTAVAIEMDAEAIMDHAMNAELSDQEFERLVTGRADPAAFLVSAMGEQ
jgi:hypothetical protein